MSPCWFACWWCPIWKSWEDPSLARTDRRFWSSASTPASLLGKFAKSLASGIESCSKALLYRCWIATRLTTDSNCCNGLLIIPLHFFLIFFSNQAFHVGKYDLRVGVNIFLDENLPVVGIARVVQQSALINVTLSSESSLWSRSRSRSRHWSSVFTLESAKPQRSSTSLSSTYSYLRL